MAVGAQPSDFLSDVGESKTFGGGGVSKFSAVLKRGAKNHEIRLRPFSTISTAFASESLLRVRRCQVTRGKIVEIVSQSCFEIH